MIDFASLWNQVKSSVTNTFSSLKFTQNNLISLNSQTLNNLETEINKLNYFTDYNPPLYSFDNNNNNNANNNDLYELKTTLFDQSNVSVALCVYLSVCLSS